MRFPKGISVFVALAGATAFAEAANADPSDGNYGDHMMYGGWFMGPFIVAIVVVSRLFGTGSKSGSALHILEERFARGEIDRDEFEERRKALSR